MQQDPIPLDVFFRGDRTYIQGTQIVARLSELLPPGDWTLDQAIFSRLAAGPLLASRGEVANPAGRVQFLSDTGATCAFALAEGPGTAPRRDSAMPISIRRQDSGADDGAVWTYDGAERFEDLLNVVVQSIKAEHSVRWPAAADIWFTGLRKLRLPVSPPVDRAGTLTLSLYRQIGVAGQVQTIWQIRAPFADPSGIVTFTAKLPE